MKSYKCVGTSVQKRSRYESNYIVNSKLPNENTDAWTRNKKAYFPEKTIDNFLIYLSFK